MASPLNRINIFLPLVKIDKERRLVIGRAAVEEPDKAGEIMDYERSKPAFKAWSAAAEQRTAHLGPDGLSKGNIRAMHMRSAVGKVVDLAFNDADKAVDIAAYIGDPVDWDKCLKGIYTGFSVGGGYAQKWKDGALTRYVPKIGEISLVDNPCMPGALFAELVKADGMSEQIQLRGVVRTFADLWTSRPRSFAEQWDARPVRPLTFGERYGKAA